MSPPTNDGKEGAHPRVGEVFNPYKRFKSNLLIPGPMARYRGLQPGAKLVYGRLRGFAGINGNCYPAVATLAGEVGLGERQVQKYLKTLEKQRFLRRSKRRGERQTNNIEFLWHSIFDEVQTSPSSPGEVNSETPGVVNSSSPKEVQSEGVHGEGVKSDIDCSPTNRKERDSQANVCLPPSQCKEYPQLQEMLTWYMREPGVEEVPPKPRHVVEVMDAAGGAGEEAVIECLIYLHKERGLKPGTKNGPRSYNWFATVVKDHFERHQRMGDATSPDGYDEWADRNAARDDLPF